MFFWGKWRVSLGIGGASLRIGCEAANSQQVPTSSQKKLSPVKPPAALSAWIPMRGRQMRSDQCEPVYKNPILYCHWFRIIII